MRGRNSAHFVTCYAICFLCSLFVWRPSPCSFGDLRHLFGISALTVTFALVSCDICGASLVQIMFDHTSDFGYVFKQNRMIHRMIHVILESSGSDLLPPDSSFLATELGAYSAKKTQADRVPSSGSLAPSHIGGSGTWRFG